MNNAPKIETGLTSLNTVEEAISQRRSLRGFLNKPVEREVIERILFLAGRAPSGTNMQPWKGHVMTGNVLKRFGEGLLTAANDPNAENNSEFSYYPDEFFEPYKGRRRKVGWDLYGLLGIKKGDFEKTKAQHDRNLIFFDAPVGMIFTIHRDLKIGSCLDFGMFLQNVMILARSHGLETIREFIPVGDENIVVCGMAIGFADWSRPENALIPDREPLENYVSFMS